MSWSGADGTYSLTGTATDNLGGTATSAAVTHTINVPPSAGTTLFTLTAKNDSGSTQATNWLTKSFGMAFKEGDLGSTEYPVIELADGTNVPATFFSIANWPSGSRRFMGCIARVPSTVAGSGTLTLNVKNGGSAPSSSGMNNAGITGASSVDVQMVALQGWSGTQTSAVNQGITDGTAVVIGDGPAGRVIRVTQEFNDGTSDHEHAACFHYIFQLKDSVGGLYGLRHRAKITHGRTDGTSALNPLAASSLVVRNAGSAVLTMAAGQNIRPFFRSGGQLTTTGGTAAEYYLSMTGMPVVLTTTNTLPAGLSTGTVYWLRPTDNVSLGETVDTFALYPTAADALAKTNVVTTTTDGTGSHTLTEVPCVYPYSAGPLTSNTDGDYTFIAAGGSGAETTCNIWQDKAYLISTKLIGPRRTDIAPNALTTRSVYFDQWTEYGVSFGGTGERPEIGIIPADAVAAMLNQTKNDRKTLLAHQMQMHQQTWEMRSGAARVPLNLTNSTHANMPTKTPTAYYRPSTGNPPSSGLKAPSTLNRKYFPYEWSHQPRPVVGAYIITAEPDYLDSMNGIANAAIMTSISRTDVVGGTTYYNIVQNERYQRMEAWIMAESAYARMFALDTHWDSINYRAYYDEILGGIYDWYLAKKATMTSFAQTNKFLATPTFMCSPWSESFLVMTAINVHLANGDADVIPELEDRCEFFNKIRINRGLFHVGSFQDSYPINAAGGGRQAITSWDQWLPSGVFGGISWDASTDTFTYSVTSSGPQNAQNPDAGTMTNGSPFIFVAPWMVLPGGMSYETVYYIGDVNTTAKTFRAYSDAGLTTLVDITNTAVASDKSKHFGYLPNVSTTVMNSEAQAKNTPHKIWAALAWAKANGYTVDSTLWSEVDGRISVYETGWEPDLKADPTYLIKETY